MTNNLFELATELHSTIDNIEKEFTSFRQQLDECEKTERVRFVEMKVKIADRSMAEGFELLDSLVLDKLNDKKDTESNLPPNLQVIGNLLRQAEENIDLALEKSTEIEESSVPDSFDISSSIAPLVDETHNAKDIAEKLERESKED